MSEAFTGLYRSLFRVLFQEKEVFPVLSVSMPDVSRVALSGAISRGASPDGKVSLEGLRSAKYGSITLEMLGTDGKPLKEFSVRFDGVQWLPFALDANDSGYALETVILCNVSISEVVTCRRVGREAAPVAGSLTEPSTS